MRSKYKYLELDCKKRWLRHLLAFDELLLFGSVSTTAMRCGLVLDTTPWVWATHAPNPVVQHSCCSYQLTDLPVMPVFGWVRRRWWAAVTGPRRLRRNIEDVTELDPRCFSVTDIGLQCCVRVGPVTLQRRSLRCEPPSPSPSTLRPPVGRRPKTGEQLRSFLVLHPLGSLCCRPSSGVLWPKRACRCACLSPAFFLETPVENGSIVR